MAKNMSLPSFQYQIVTWWRKHTDGKLPKGNELKHIAQQNYIVGERLATYAEQNEDGRYNNDICDELALMLQNIALIAYCVDVPINDIFEAALPGEKE